MKKLKKYIESNNEETEEVREFLRENYEYKEGDFNRVKCKNVCEKYNEWVKMGVKKMQNKDLCDLFEEVFDVDERKRYKDGLLWKNVVVKDIIE